MLRAGGRSRLLAPGLRRLLAPAAAAGERAAPALATARANQRVVDACFKSFGCGSSAIASSSSSFGLSKQTAIGGLREAFLKSGDAAHASSIKNSRWYMIHSNSSGSLTARKECHKVLPSSIRPCASYSTKASENKPKQERTDLQTIEDPFDAPTYNIPEKPVTFAEGASYSVVILAGLGVAALAGYAVFKELIFEPKEYKMFGKALARVQSDSQVTAKIGYPITGYGTESRNRAARQRIQNRVWTDEDGVEHVEVGFHIRGPHGAGKVFAEMFKDSSDRQWKFTFLLVEITSPRHAQIMLESYIPA